MIGEFPEDEKIYRKALTHKSYKNSDLNSNETLEFLGDAVLSLTVADFLFKNYPDRNEGFLTSIRSKIVNRKMLNELALKIELEKYIVANNVSFSNNSVVGNAFEAFIAAVFIDKGYTFTQNFVNHLIKEYLDIDSIERNDFNFKSRLIELLQRQKKSIRFESEKNESTTNQDFFIANIFIENELLCCGTGKSKKDAEQSASQRAIQLLDESNIDKSHHS